MFLVEEEKEKKLRANIKVIGVGGGGNNAIETMIRSGIKEVDFISVNTDSQALESSSANEKIQLGTKLTKGLGAGANPEIGKRATIESYEEVSNIIDGADMIFITAGMGGGTGTGGAPVIAEIARKKDILTVGIVTQPFSFEGQRRKKFANRGIQELKKYVDTLIVISNDKLLDLCDKKTPLLKTFEKTDDVLLQAVKGISELINRKGLINLDFADIKTVMKNKGMALMGIGVAEGDNRTVEAVSRAISSPLLKDISIQGAKGMVVNITAGANLTLSEINEITSLLTKNVDSDGDIIVGAVIDEEMKNSLIVTVIATGFEQSIFEKESASKENISKIFQKETIKMHNVSLLKEDQKEDRKEENSHYNIRDKESIENLNSEFEESHNDMSDSISTPNSVSEATNETFLENDSNIQNDLKIQDDSIITKDVHNTDPFDDISNDDCVSKKNHENIKALNDLEEDVVDEDENKIESKTESHALHADENKIESKTESHALHADENDTRDETFLENDSNIQNDKKNEDRVESVRNILLAKADEYNKEKYKNNQSNDSDLENDSNIQNDKKNEDRVESVRNILLAKADEYNKEKYKNNQSNDSDEAEQVLMDLDDFQLEEDSTISSSPFETKLDFFEDDLK